MANDFAVISADSHLSEPPELHQRLPAAYRERAPRVEERDGAHYFVAEGQAPMPIAAPNPLSEDDKRRYWREEGDDDVGRVFHRAGGTDVDLRLRDQEEDGISAEVIYPNGVFTLFSSPDPDYQLAIARLYNDFYHEVFGPHPDRFVVSGVLPVLDIGAAVKEVERLAGLGFRTVSVPIVTPSRPYNRPEFEPLWSVLEETGLVLGLHTFSYENASQPDGPMATGPGEDLKVIVVDMAAAMTPLCHLVASGVLERHPKLRFVLAECGIGWLAWVLQTLDQMQLKRHMWMEPRLELRPSEYFRRQGALTFTDDVVGLRNRDLTGVECLMWGNDYPHDEGTFPHSHEAIERNFAGVPEADKRAILSDNAARLYGLPTTSSA